MQANARRHSPDNCPEEAGTPMRRMTRAQRWGGVPVVDPPPPARRRDDSTRSHSPVDRMNMQLVGLPTGSHPRTQQSGRAPVCSLCSRDLKVNQEIGTPVCNHQFHRKCIRILFTLRPNCPTCDRSIHWTAENTWTIPPFGTITIEAPGLFWEGLVILRMTSNDRSPASDDEGEEQNLPLSWRATTSRATLPGSDPELELNERTRGLQISESPQMDGSPSPIDGGNVESASLPSTSPRDQQMEEGPPVCSLCSQEMKVLEETSSLTCQHRFHHRCILRLLPRKPYCPLCWKNIKFWNRRPPFSITTVDGEPTVTGLQEQGGSTRPIEGSRLVQWRRGPEAMVANTFTRQWLATSSQRYRSSSSLDRNHPEPGSSQGPTISDQQREQLPPCYICLEDVQEGADVSRLPCSHCFHNDCINRWMDLRNVCPSCHERVIQDVQYTFPIKFQGEMSAGEMTVRAPGYVWSRQPEMVVLFTKKGQALFLTVRSEENEIPIVYNRLDTSVSVSV